MYYCPTNPFNLFGNQINAHYIVQRKLGIHLIMKAYKDEGECRAYSRMRTNFPAKSAELPNGWRRLEQENVQLLSVCLMLCKILKSESRVWKTDQPSRVWKPDPAESRVWKTNLPCRGQKHRPGSVRGLWQRRQNGWCSSVPRVQPKSASKEKLVQGSTPVLLLFVTGEKVNGSQYLSHKARKTVGRELLPNQRNNVHFWIL